MLEKMVTFKAEIPVICLACPMWISFFAGIFVMLWRKDERNKKS